MLDDGVRASGGQMRVADVSTLLAESLGDDAPASSPLSGSPSSPDAGAGS